MQAAFILFTVRCARDKIGVSLGRLIGLEVGARKTLGDVGRDFSNLVGGSALNLSFGE